MIHHISRVKKESHVMVPIGAENSTAIHDENLQQTRNRRESVHNPVKGIYRHMCQSHMLVQWGKK